MSRVPEKQRNSWLAGRARGRDDIRQSAFTAGTSEEGGRPLGRDAASWQG